METLTKPREVEKDEKKGISRRDFIKVGAAAGTAVVVAACTPNIATTSPGATTTATPPPTTTTPPTTTPSAETYMFFNGTEAATIKAVVGRLIPGTAQDPGAVQAGAHVYIDHALAGPYAAQRETYRRGIASINAYSQSKNKQDFASLSAAQQDAILTDMQTGAATGFYAPAAAAFFSTLVAHVREGTFCDPLYGGNQGAVGWKMVGFPGAQVAYGEGDMKVGGIDQTTKAPITLADSEDMEMPSPQNGF
jgi:gluconate 2-dehydrogenase gamma chain